VDRGEQFQRGERSRPPPPVEPERSNPTTSTAEKVTYNEDAGKAKDPRTSKPSGSLDPGAPPEPSKQDTPESHATSEANHSATHKADYTDQPISTANSEATPTAVHLCKICGQPGKLCKNWNAVAYCGKTHQQLD
jgi:hypothetical protein